MSNKAYVIIVGRPFVDDADLVAVLADSAKDAMYEAEVQYRLSRGLGPNEEIVTHPTYECDTTDEARDFIRKVVAGLPEAE